MISFEDSLRSERLTDARNMPPNPQGNAVFIGPTAVDLSLANQTESPRERQMIADWHKSDLNDFYRQQRSNRYR